MTTNMPTLLALLFAVGAGISVSIQSTIVTTFGTSIGPVRTAFFVHLGGAIVGAVILASLLTREPAAPLPVGNLPRLSLLFLAAGSMGMIVLPAIAVSFPKVGLVTGQVAIIGGQAGVALLVDTMGWAGNPPIPLTWQRLMGLALLVVATYLLIPKTE